MGVHVLIKSIAPLLQGTLDKHLCEAKTHNQFISQGLHRRPKTYLFILLSIVELMLIRKIIDLLCEIALD